MPQPPRYTLNELLAMIDEPNQSICRRLISDHPLRFNAAAGSSRIHQAWQGGYHDHVVEAMNLVVVDYRAWEPLGRFELLPPEQRFALSDALVVLFWHDIEKSWRSRLDESGNIIFKPDGSVAMDASLATKEQRAEYAARIIVQYGVVLSLAMRNALKYVEGIRDSDYTPNEPLMWPLAVLCHRADLASARAFREYPLAQNDPWGGACRSAR
ncbi:MAG TPA: hypothetical protein VM581_00955 [Magnetospirillaceae bacterium]|nr:hypothetical protein [Magnetospirillaceae bacterium]